MINKVDATTIHEIVCQGQYSSNPEFHKKPQNIRTLIKYAEQMNPSQQSVSNARKIIRFYRLPAIIAFRYLYSTIRKLAPQQMPSSMREILMDIETWVHCLLQNYNIGVFKEIQFIFGWGKIKKKYKIEVAAQQVQFAKFIYNLSKKKQKLNGQLKVKQDLQDQLQIIQGSVFPKILTPFQDNFINLIKENAVREVSNQIQQLKQQQKQKTSIIEKKTAVKPRQNQTKKSKFNETQIINSQRKLPSKKDNRTLNKDENAQISASEKVKIEDQLPYQLEKNMPMCCRTYFIADQVIQQAENETIQYKHYSYPFRARADQVPSKQQKIKRVLCGFLNNAGGIIFFGIKQHPQTKKRQIYGYTFTQMVKYQFEDDIFVFLQDVLPDVQKRCVVKWVPIKNRQTLQFEHGRYIAKVIIEKGAKDHIYSYVHDKVQTFVCKTQNQFIIMQEAQKVLKFFRNKLQNPQRPMYKIHSNPCKQPLKGKPVYKQQNTQNNRTQTKTNYRSNILPASISRQQFPSLLSESENYNDKIVPEKKEPKIKFKQKSNEYLLEGSSIEAIQTLLKVHNIPSSSIVNVDENNFIVTIKQTIHVEHLLQQNNTIHYIFSSVQVSLQQQSQKQIVQDTIKQLQKVLKTVIKIRNKDIITFYNSKLAAQFWLKITAMGIKAHFTNTIE